MGEGASDWRMRSKRGFPMKSGRCFTAGASAVALAGLFLVATGASAHPIYRPYHRWMAAIDPNLPLPHVGPYSAPYKAHRGTSGTWTDVGGVPFSGQGGWGPLQLTDGTVMMKQSFTGTAGKWYKLTPDKKGKYTTGTWTTLASMPAGYQPDFYASQVLTDGRVIINGGEYNQGSGVWTTKGALYDPATNTWTSVSPPSGWSTIGDAQSIILPNGSYMLADCCAAKQAIATISGTTVTWSTGISYGDNDEEHWAALPNGNVMTVDVWNLPGNKDDFEIYNTSTGTWNLQGQTADLLTTTQYRELGPAALTPQGPAGGTIVQCGANPTQDYNDIYSVASNSWSTGPFMAVGATKYDCSDAPATTLPNGNVLVQASPGTFSTPSHFWEFRYAKRAGVWKATQVSDPIHAASTSSFESNLMPLPTGEVLWDQSQAGTEVAVYKPVGKAKAAWLPVVSSVNSSLNVGSTGNAISGSNFNGFDLGGVYGDDAQSATNFPLVRITNNGTGDVCYAKSYNFSTMGVWTTGTTNATFDIPNSCETGASTLQVVVNGIASTGTAVTLS
jgi:hypothetical protein